MTTALPPLVVFAPLPPNRSGIAAYTAELLPGLARHRAVTVVVATDADAAAAPPGLPARVISQRSYEAEAGLHAAPHLHQLGNSLDHAHVYRAALRRPGIVVMHEVVLHHLVEALTLGRGSPHAYAAALAAEYGPAGRRLARLRGLGLFAPMQRFLMPLHGAVLAQAQGAIVHSRFAATRLQGPPDLPVTIIPHPLSPSVLAHDGMDRAAARERLGLPADTPVLVALGHVTPAKQIETALHALALLRDQGVRPLLVVGGPMEAGMALAESAARLGLAGQVRLTGWLSEEAFFQHLRAADLLLALRFPVGGESSGSLARALGMGTPALAYDFGPAAEYADAILAKVAFTADPAPDVAAAIGRLLADPAGLERQGRAARNWMRTHCDIAATADAYMRAIAVLG